MDALKDALHKHLSKAKAAKPEVDLGGDQAPELEGHAEGAEGGLEALLASGKLPPELLEALLGHGGALASHASKMNAPPAPGADKQHEKMASIQKHKGFKKF